MPFDRGADRGAVHVERSGLPGGERGVERRLGGGDLRDILLVRFPRDQIAEREVALRHPLRLLQRRACARDTGVGLAQRVGVARQIDHEQQLAPLYPLVVAHCDRGDQSADIGRHAHHIGADMAIARPRIGLVAAPQPDRHQHGQEHD